MTKSHKSNKPSLSPLETWTALNAPLEDHLIDSGQSVGLRIPEGPLEQVFQPRPQPPVSAVDDHRHVLRYDGGL